MASIETDLGKGWELSLAARGLQGAGRWRARRMKPCRGWYSWTRGKAKCPLKSNGWRHRLSGQGALRSGKDASENGWKTGGLEVATFDWLGTGCSQRGQRRLPWRGQTD